MIIYVLSYQIPIFTLLLLAIAMVRKWIPVKETYRLMLIGTFLLGFISGEIIFAFKFFDWFFWPGSVPGNLELLIRSLILSGLGFVSIVLFCNMFFGEQAQKNLFYTIDKNDKIHLTYVGFIYSYSVAIWGLFIAFPGLLLDAPAPSAYLAMFLNAIIYPLSLILVNIPKLNHKQVSFISATIYFVLFISVYAIFPPYFQAIHYNSQINVTTDAPFESEIPPDLVMLVGRKLAYSTMSRYISEFGSNAILGLPHVVLKGNDLVWISPVYPANLLAQNYILGFIVLHANDPLEPVEIIKKRFYIGNQLIGGNNIGAHVYLEDSAVLHPTGYYAFDETGNIVAIVPKVNKMLGLDYDYHGSLNIYDENGKLVKEYKNPFSSEVPDWIPQLLDNGLIMEMMYNWGGYRRGNSIDFFAGGFLVIPTSSNRIEPSHTVRYIINPDNHLVEGFVNSHPVGNDRTFSGILRVSKEGISYHDLSSLNLISGNVAQDLAESLPPKPATGYYYATFAMIYPVKHPVTNDTEWTWYVPLYWENEGTTVLAGMALINAKDISIRAYDLIQQDEHGVDFVNRLVNEYKNVLQAAYLNQSEIFISTTVLSVQKYDINGTTHVVLHLNNETFPFVEATSSDLSTEEWYELLFTESGDQVEMKIKLVESKWVIVEFDNLNIG